MIKYLKRMFVMEVKQLVAYPTSFWVAMLTVPLFTVVQIVFLETIYAQTESFAGYTKYEGYVLFGTFTMVQTLGYLFFYWRLADLKGMIRGDAQESFDTALLRPLDAQITTTIGRYNFGNIPPFLIAVFVVSYGFYMEPHLVSMLSIFHYVAIVLMAVALFYFTFLFASTFLFWFPELQMTEALWETILAYGQYPSALYQRTTGVIFNFILPLTIMASVPVDFLLGRKPIYYFWVYLSITIIIFLLTRWFWKVAIKNYSGFSS
jgi:ABC-2 type transport system permease protein